MNPITLTTVAEPLIRQALAEDIVQGFATELNCIHLLKERLSFMASQMVEMAEATRE